MSEEIKSASEQKKEDWMNSKWRPMMGWLYMATCTFDFVIFPVLWSLLQAVTKGQITQWQPLTLQGAGLYHIAMGAVLGLAAFGRTQEKLAGANNGGAGANLPASGPSTFGAPAAGGFGAPSSFSPPAAAPATASGGFSGGFGAPVTTPAFTPRPTTMTSSTGKPMPVQPDHPEI